MEISFLRHGETEANVAGVWQGSRHGGVLTDRGREQAAAAAGRISKKPYDLVITSGLDRAVHTASALGVHTESDPSWQEMDLGEWDGMTFAEISEIYGDELIAVFSGQPVAMGRTGETILEANQRVSDARERLEGRLSDGERALVVTHGGIIEQLVRMHWGIDAPTAPFAGPLNTSLTSFRRVFGKLRLATYNDTAHLGFVNDWTAERMRDGDPLITLVRHGETDANVQGRVQGQTDWGLNDQGRIQAAALASWYGRQDHVFASPMGRAAETAAAIALDGVTEVPEFAELHFGSWEGLTFDDVRTEAAHADLADRIFMGGEDLPRGGDGETWAQLTARMRNGIESVVVNNSSSPVTIVSHGGAIRAYVLGNMGVGWPDALDTVVPANTAVTRVVITSQGPVLADYAVAAHLE